MAKAEKGMGKFSKNVTLDMKSIVIVDQTMHKQDKNFSQAVDYLIHSADYLIKKLELLQEESKYDKETKKEEQNTR